MTPEALGDFFQRFGFPLGALIIVLVTGHRKLWVFGWYAATLEARVERLEHQRDRALGQATQALDLTEKVT